MGNELSLERIIKQNVESESPCLDVLSFFLFVPYQFRSKFISFHHAQFNLYNLFFYYLSVSVPLSSEAAQSAQILSMYPDVEDSLSQVAATDTDTMEVIIAEDDLLIPSPPEKRVKKEDQLGNQKSFVTLFNCLYLILNVFFFVFFWGGGFFSLFAPRV